MEEPSEERKIFAVGDIHGCYRKLARLMERLPLDPERDVLVFLGDYVNKGPDSREVIRFLMEIERRVAQTVFLLGNHEYDILEYARTGNPRHLHTLRPMGVEATLKSYGNSPVRSLRELSFLPEPHRTFFGELKRYYRQDQYLFIHAGIIPGEDPDDSPLDSLLTVRNIFLTHPEPLNETVVFGHTAFETPFVMPDRIGIDTGAAYGNILTAVELPGLRFYHA